MFSALTFNQQHIVNRGLIFYLDAADKTSFPETGENWYNIGSGSGYAVITNTGPPLAFNSTIAEGRGSLGFDGTNDFYTADSPNYNTNLLNTGGPGTFSVWFKVDTANTNTSGGPLIGYDNANGDNTYFNVGRAIQQGNNRTNAALLFGSDEGANNSTVEAEVSDAANYDRYQDGNWWNITLTVSSNEIVVYANGSVIPNSSITYNDGSSTTGNWLLRNAGAVYIGKNAISSPANRVMYFNGDLAIVKIYNRSLSLTEVQQNYNALKGRFNLN